MVLVSSIFLFHPKGPILPEKPLQLSQPPQSSFAPRTLLTLTSFWQPPRASTRLLTDTGASTRNLCRKSAASTGNDCIKKIKTLHTRREHSWNADTKIVVDDYCCSPKFVST